MKFIIEKGDKSLSQPVPCPSNVSDDPTFLHYNIYRPSGRVQCDQCKRNISKGAKILYQSEEDQFVDLCMSCFSNQDDFNRGYHVVNKLNFPLLDPSWTAQEELLMFQGLKSHGYGNWRDIADYIGATKTKQQVEQHYQRVFLDHPNFMPLDKVLTKRQQNGSLSFPKTEAPPKLQAQQQPKQTNQPPSTNSTASLRKARNSTGKQPPAKQSTNPAQVVGFMPRRVDFQVQYDNDAQLLLAEMEFNDDDSEQQKAMKFRLIDIYNHKLTERIKRKEFVVQRKLLDIREQMRLDKTRTKEEKEIHNLMKVVARFNGPEEHDQLVQNIIKEKQLRQRIAELKELMAKGFRSWGQVEDELQGKRKKDDKSKKKEDLYPMDKSKTRRVARKDPTSDKSQRRVIYITREEEQLCNKMNMTFKQYTAVKEKMMREAVRSGGVEINQIADQLHVPRKISDAVLDFLVEQEDILVREKDKDNGG